MAFSPTRASRLQLLHAFRVLSGLGPNWFETPNIQLSGRTPNEMIAAGREEVVANLLDDILDGSPN